MKDNREELLSFDPLDVAETIMGEKSDTATFLGAMLAMDSNERKKAALAAADDTHWGQSMAEYIACIERMGFELVLSEPIEGESDVLRIFWRPGLLLRVDSYGGDTVVNSANVYWNYRGPRDAIFHGSHGFAAEVDGVPVWEGNHDAREGLRFRIEKMEAAGTFLNPWVSEPFIWLLSYGDSKVPGYSYDKINAERMAKLPEHVNLCSACAPTRFEDGTKTEYGSWHGQFPRVFLPPGEFRTARNGNLEHVETGDQDFRKYAIASQADGEVKS